MLEGRGAQQNEGSEPSGVLRTNAFHFTVCMGTFFPVEVNTVFTFAKDGTREVVAERTLDSPQGDFFKI